jgi:hypothetical protein
VYTLLTHKAQNSGGYTQKIYLISVAIRIYKSTIYCTVEALLTTQYNVSTAERNPHTGRGVRVQVHVELLLTGTVIVFSHAALFLLQYIKPYDSSRELTETLT